MGTASERTAEALRDMIGSGRFSPGDRLPRESDLADEIGVSKGTLRSAVASLAGSGVLRVRQGDGTYVGDLDAEHLLRPLAAAMPLLNDQSVADLHQFRTLLEPHAVAYAVPNFTAGIDARLSELADQMESHTDDMDAHMELDDAFHAVLVDALGNQVLSELMRIVSVQARRARIWRTETDPDAIAAINLDHRTILSAVLERDVEATRSALHLHLRDAERWLRLAMQHAPGSRLGISAA